MLNRIGMIRTFSCLLIATYHVLEFLRANSVDGQVPWGFAFARPGFHLFLLISGAILVSTTKPDAQPVDFLAKRMARIVPLYWLCTAAAIALAATRAWLLPAADLSPAAIVSSFLFLPDVDLVGSTMPILFVGWTINYLVFFYLLMALSLLTPPRTRSIVLISSLLLVMVIASEFREYTAGEFYSHPLLLEFATGVVVGAVINEARVAQWVKTHSLAPFLVVGAAGMLTATIARLDEYAVALAFSASGGLVLVWAFGSDLYKTPLRNRIFERGGQISYAVLLAHPLLISPVGVVLIRFVQSDELRALLLIPVVLGLTVAAANVLYTWVERPANDWLRGLLPARPKLKATT